MPADLIRVLTDTSRRLGLTQAAAAGLALHATGRLDHVYEGRCPDESDRDRRDDHCPVCRALVLWDDVARPHPTDAQEGTA